MEVGSSREGKSGAVPSQRQSWEFTVSMGRKRSPVGGGVRECRRWVWEHVFCPESTETQTSKRIAKPIAICKGVYFTLSPDSDHMPHTHRVNAGM